MAVKGIQIAGAVMAATLLAGCGSAKTNAEKELAYTGVWQAQPLVIDGNDNDWAKPLPYSDKDVAYRISNDSVYLYIQLSAKQGLTQQKILQAGLTVWINNAAETSDQNAARIACPTRNNRSGRSTTIATNSAGGRAMAQDNIKDYMLFGFSDEGVDNYNYGDSNRAGVEVKLDFNEAGELIYEAAVPLRSLYPKTTLHRYAGRNLAVGIFIEALPSQNGGNNGGGGVSIGGGLGMGSYGSGGGVGLSIGTGAFGLGGGGKKYKPTKLWQIVPIARAPRK